MDAYSGKGLVNSNTIPKKKSNSASRNVTNSKDEVVQLCTRIGCSGRLNHTIHTPKQKDVKINDLNTRSKLKSKFQDGQTRSNRDVLNLKRIGATVGQTGSNREALNLKPVGNTVVQTRSNRDVLNLNRIGNTVGQTGSNRFALNSKLVGNTAGQTGSLSNTRKAYGQRLGLANQDDQSGSFDRGRRSNVVKKRSTEGETSSSARASGGGSSVRTRRPVSVSVNNPSSVQSTRVLIDNVDSIANVLLALERIDQDEGLSFEQLLGTSFFGGFNFYDQYRGMRLDIDNMSYEQLLALEDEMGVVSTALSEEELSKCLRISVYKYKPLHIKDYKIRGNCCLDDTKCSICQEEFIVGEEIGKMRCDHGYHAACIHQWLQLKNWCPICKASAQP